jgi:hypothetical protein
VFGGLHGDVPLEPTSGAMIADLVVDRALSCVIDVSQFESDAAKARFASAFAERFFFRKKASPSAVHLFIEECQEFVPEKPSRDENMMLHHFTRMAKLGRNFGIGISLITQRPQEVSKKVLNLTECLFAFQMTGVHERRAIRDWVSAKGADVNIVDLLPTLAVGVAHVYSPQWLQISESVKVYEKRSADVSSTPQFGAQVVESKPLTKVDLAELRTTMAATIEKAKADDPKELRKEIARLMREVTLTKVQPATAVVNDAAIGQAVADATKMQAERFDGLLLAYKRLLANVEECATGAASLADGMRGTLDNYKDVPFTIEHRFPSAGVNMFAPPTTRRTATATVALAVPSPRAVLAAPAEGVSASEQKLLDALALMEKLGTPSERINLAFFSGYTVAGRFNNLVGGLRTRGLVDYPTGGEVVLSDEGRAIANADAHSVRSQHDLHELWLAKLPASEGKVLQVLMEAYPNELSRYTLAERTDYTVAGRFNNIVGKLRTLGAIEYPGSGTVRASDVLFPRGLR